MSNTLSWERVFEIPNKGNGMWEGTFRAKVDGGWLYRHRYQWPVGSPSATPTTMIKETSVIESMAFVPESIPVAPITK